jgi:16S rRNA (guanine(527)-N(7))-methyltransferase RsmG
VGRLETLMRWYNWERANYSPETAPELRELQLRLTLGHTAAAVSVLRESLSALSLEPVRVARRGADIGSGVGYPGLILAIARPQLHMTLVEKRAEKCSFLRHAAEELGSDNVDVYTGPVVDWSAGVGACDLVTSRRFGRPETILGWFRPLLAPNGAIVLFDRRRSDEQSPEAERAAAAAGLVLKAVHSAPQERPDGRVVVKWRRQFVYVKSDAT